MKNLLVLLLSVMVLTLKAQEVTTVAGTGSIGGTDGPAAEASFNNPHGIAADNQGNIYVAERYGHRIRKISSSGIVTTLAGSGEVGNADGIGTSASFYEPWGICVGVDGNIYVADTKNNLIRKITPAGEVSTFAGNGSYGITDGPAEAASFGNPTGIDSDPEGNLYIADHLTHIIRKITPDGTVSRIAGAPFCHGLVDGPSGNALFNRPYGLAFDEVSGNVIIADEWNHVIRSITPDGAVKTIAGNGTQGHTDADGDYATFNYPWDVTTDDQGNIFVADGYNHSMRKLVPSGGAPASYLVATFAGTSGDSGYADGYGTEAKFNGAASLHYSKSSQEVFIADTYNNMIRKIVDNNEQSIMLDIVNNEQGVICENDECKAIAFPAVFDTYIFFINGEIVQSGSNGVYATENLTAGEYNIMVHGISTHGSFISNEFTITIQPTPTPLIETVGDLPMPQGSSVLLKTDPEAISCVWSNGATTETIEVAEPDIITVDVLYPNGCIGTSEPVNVQQYCNVETPIIEFADNSNDCDCFISSTTLVTDYEGGDIQWLYYGVPIPGATGNSYEVTETGVYQIMVTTYEQQIYSNILHAHISQPFLEDFTANKTTIDEDDPVVKFKPHLYYNWGWYSYKWEFGDPDSGDENTSTQKRPKHKFTGVGTYTISLAVTDNYTGCVQKIQKPNMISYIEELDEGETGNFASNNNIIFIPNAFTPNGDGENDVLFVRGEEIDEVELFVYNQNGQLVFQSDDQAEGWDGNINGQPAANETYSYKAKVKMSNGDEEMRSGKVFLIR